MKKKVKTELKIAWSKSKNLKVLESKVLKSTQSKKAQNNLALNTTRCELILDLSILMAHFVYDLSFRNYGVRPREDPHWTRT